MKRIELLKLLTDVAFLRKKYKSYETSLYKINLPI